MNNIVEVAETFFGGVWKMLLETDFPGTNVSMAAVTISLFIASFSLRLLGVITGFGAGAADYGRAADRANKIRNSENYKAWRNDSE